MMKKSLKRVVSGVLLGAMALTLTLGSPMMTKAATYQTSLTRGIKYLCWSKDTVTWKANGTKVSSWEGDQKRSGILVELKGIEKKSLLSSSKTYALLCKHTLLVGAELNGVTLGWNTDVNDMLYVKHNGTSSVTWDY